MAETAVRQRVRTEKAAPATAHTPSAAAPAVELAAQDTKDAGPRKAKAKKSTNVAQRLGDMNSIGGRLTIRRNELGIEQEVAASRMGVARAAYSQYETGKVVPSVEKIIALAEALKVPPWWIAFGIGKRTAPPIMRYEPAIRGWVHSDDRDLPLPEKWFMEHFPDVDVNELCAVEAPNNTALLTKGDLVILDRSAEPSAEHADEEFVFVMAGEARVSRIRKAEGGYEVFAADNKQSQTRPRKSVDILGKVTTYMAGGIFI